MIARSGSDPVSADHLPQPHEVLRYDLTFKSTMPDMYGPGGAVPRTDGLDIFDFTWNEGFSLDTVLELDGSFKFLGENIGLPTSRWGQELSGRSSGQLGADVNVAGFPQGNVTIDYPVEAIIEVPPKDSFRRGEQIVIRSSWTPKNGRIIVNPSIQEQSSTRVEMEGIFAASNTIKTKLCVFDCTPDLQLFPVDTLLPDFDGGGIISFPPIPGFSTDLPGCSGVIDPSQFASLEIPTFESSSPETAFVIDLLDDVGISAKDVATALVDAQEAGRSVSQDPILKFYSSMLGGISSAQISKMSALLNLADKMEDCGIGTDRKQKIGALDGYLSNFTEFGCCSGTVGLPNLRGVKTSVSGSGRLTANGSDRFIDATVDPIAFVDSKYPLAFKLNVCDHFPSLPSKLKEGCPEVSYTVISAPIDVRLTQNASFTFDPDLRVRLALSEPVQYSISPCSPDSRFGAFPCSGTSDTITYNLGSDVTIIVPSGDFHTADIEPTFSLGGFFDNDITVQARVDANVKAGQFEYKGPKYELVPSFTLIPKVGVCDLCTPEVKFPGLTIPSDSSIIKDVLDDLGLGISDLEESFKSGKVGPLFEKRLFRAGVSDSSFPIFDRADSAWMVNSFNSISRPAFGVDTEVRPTADIAGPTVLNEGDAAQFTGIGSTEIDFDEFLTFDWDFGDGTVDFGDSVQHPFVDNGNFLVQVTADDGHQLTDTASQGVTVDNVAPTLITGGRDAAEGELVDLSLFPFNRQLLTNPGAEDGVLGWIASPGFAAQAYAPQGTARPMRGTVLVDNTTPGYYNDDLGQILDRSSYLFPENRETIVTLYDGINYGGFSRTYNTDFTSGATGLNEWASSLKFTKKSKANSGIRLNAVKEVFQIPVPYSFNFTGNVSNLKTHDIYAWHHVHELHCHGFEVYGICAQAEDGNLEIGYHEHTHLHEGKKYETVKHCHGSVLSGVCLGSDGSSFSGSEYDIFGFHLHQEPLHFLHKPANNSAVGFDFINIPPVLELNIPNAPEPDLTQAAGTLGDWLVAHAPESGTGWSADPETVPTTWPRRHENAIVYEIDAGEAGIQDVLANLSVDNGIWVWVDGVFKFGAIEQGVTTFGYEYVDIPLGDFTPGKHYVQILRSDYYNDTGYNVLITGTTQGDVPAVDTPGPFQRGASHFFGGADIGSSGASQTIDVSEGEDLIDLERVTYELAGYVGGLGISEDNASVEVILKDADGAILVTDTIGPLSKDDRGEVTRLRRLVTMGAVPAGTRSVEVVIDAARDSGRANDGFVDELQLFLLAPSGAVVRDVGLADTHSGTVDWADGSLLEIPLVDQELGLARLNLAHTYPDNGLFTVGVTASDDDGGTVAGSFQMDIANLPTDVTGVANYFAAGEPVLGDPPLVVVGTFDDPGISDGPWTATINWGDGSTSPGVVDPLNKQVRGSHRYAEIGAGLDRVMFMSVTVTDKDGASSTGYADNIVVEEAVEGVHASPDRSLSEGGNILDTAGGLSGGFTTLPASKAPAGLVYEYTWDYGDGEVHGPIALGSFPPSTVVDGLSAPDHFYTKAGQYVVAFSARGIVDDSVYAVGSDNFILTVSNAAPTVESPAAVTVAEGVDYAHVANFTDPGIGSRHTSSVDWDDGTPEVVGILNELAQTVTATHAFGDNGIYTVTTTVNDDNGGTASGSYSVTVTNQEPVVNAGPNQDSVEGATVSLAFASFVDAGADDTHTAVVFWGDEAPGASGEPALLNQDLRQVSASHIYTDNGVYTVRVCVTDDDGAEGCGTMSVTVANAAPIVSAGEDRSTDEGRTVDITPTTFSDAGSGDTHTATVDWDDGSTTTASVDQTLDVITAEHVYANDGVYNVVVTVCDDDNDCGTGNIKIVVDNAAPQILDMLFESAGTVHVEGLPVNLTTDFNDLGTLDAHTATIDWGDGMPQDHGLVSETPSGPPGSNLGADGTVTGSHRYADNGGYRVTVCIDDDDSSTCQTEKISVTNAVPVVEAGSDIASVTEGAFISLDPATFTDSGFDGVTIAGEENFTASIDWGDGSTEPAEEITLVETPGSAGILTTGTAQASHAYGKYGIFTVTVCVTDDDHNPDASVPIDGRGCDTLTVTVTEVAPVVDAGPDRLWSEGLLYRLNPTTFSDVGHDGDYTAVIDWGDGTTEPSAMTTVYAFAGGEGALQTGFVQASHTYSDNGVYTIQTCVSDGRLETCDSFDVNILNEDPSIDDSGFIASAITFLSGDDAFLGKVGVQQRFEGSATDPGSDDLTFDWQFLPDLATQSRIYYNDGIGPEPVGIKSPFGNYPFTVVDDVLVTITPPGVYAVELDVADDDAGTDHAELPWLVVDRCQTSKIVPLLDQYYDDKGRVWASDEVLEAYLEISNFASGYFSGVTRSQAQDILAPAGNDKRQRATQEALGNWLNFANGSIPWDAVVPSGQLFHQAMADIEAVLSNPASTDAELNAIADLSFNINKMEIGDPNCP